MKYVHKKLNKEDIICEDNNEVIEEIIDDMLDQLKNKDVKFGSSDIIFLVEYCQLWCHVEPLFFDEHSFLMQSYKEAISIRNGKIGDFVDWNNSSFGVVVADNANQAIQKFLEKKDNISIRELIQQHNGKVIEIID